MASLSEMETTTLYLLRRYRRFSHRMKFSDLLRITTFCTFDFSADKLPASGFLCPGELVAGLALHLRAPQPPFLCSERPCHRCPRLQRLHAAPRKWNQPLG